jgi:hypothetical protein
VKKTKAAKSFAAFVPRGASLLSGASDHFQICAPWPHPDLRTPQSYEVTLVDLIDVWNGVAFNDRMLDRMLERIVV